MFFHFGHGNRQYAGRNILSMSIWKIATTLLKPESDLLEPNEEFIKLNYGVGDKKGPINKRVKRRVFFPFAR